MRPGVEVLLDSGNCGQGDLPPSDLCNSGVCPMAPARSLWKKLSCDSGEGFAAWVVIVAPGAGVVDAILTTEDTNAGIGGAISCRKHQGHPAPLPKEGGAGGHLEPLSPRRA